MTKNKSDNSRQFLLSFFEEPEQEYEEVEVNGFRLVKQWNPVLEKAIVAVYTNESFEKYKTFIANNVIKR